MVSIEQYKQRLLELRSEYTQRIDKLHIDTHHEEHPVEKDFAEQVVQRENEDVLEALDDEAKRIVMQIDNALLRIESGDFGICQRCGNEIPEARLQVIPYAQYCVSCAEKQGN